MDEHIKALLCNFMHLIQKALLKYVIGIGYSEIYS
jgi:hypothetical protein